jgi:hypothetical protein
MGSRDFIYTYEAIEIPFFRKIPTTIIDEIKNSSERAFHFNLRENDFA